MSASAPHLHASKFAASPGTQAETDRLDAEMIARSMAFCPGARRSLPQEKLGFIRSLVSKRGQLVELRKRLLAQIKAHGKLESAGMFEAMDAELKDLLDHQITGLDAQIEQTVTLDEELATTADTLRSVPGFGPAASTIPTAEMPELGQITGE